MQHFAPRVVQGMLLSMRALGATQGIIGIKAKKQQAVAAMQAAVEGTPLRVELLGDYYPAGDEYDLVYTVTGRLIPPAGLPIQVGCVVNNVETFANIAAAAEGRPVIEKTLTLAGAVNRPVTLTVPVGVTFRDAIEATGGFSTPDPVLVIGGLMMGETTENLDTPVTKTTTGVVVLPRDHHVIQRKLKPSQAQAQIGKSACDQCRYCTEYCPRYLLGYDVQPHAVMRSLAFTATGSEYWDQLAALCCACGLCTLFACPEELFPKEACDASKLAMRQGSRKWSGRMEVKPHGMREGRRVPIKSLMRKLAVEEYDHPAPLERVDFRPRRAILALKQNAGSPNLPLVTPGDRVSREQQIGAIPEKALGAPIHAPFDAVVEAVTSTHILLQRS
jgi:Na+-translocating ferredoxin:NAD+ oxidoreductase RnfC subunit